MSLSDLASTTSPDTKPASSSVLTRACTKVSASLACGSGMFSPASLPVAVRVELVRTLRTKLLHRLALLSLVWLVVAVGDVDQHVGHAELHALVYHAIETAQDGHRLTVRVAHRQHGLEDLGVRSDPLLHRIMSIII